MARLRPPRPERLAPALPMPFVALAAAGVRFRQGQLSLTVAGPGTGKSQFWANYAQRAGVSTVYWSADTDETDVMLRTTAMWTGITTEEIERNLYNPAWQQWFSDALAGKHEHIDWVFDPTITDRGVGERMNAFGEVHGGYPRLFVVDNLSNTNEHGGDEYQEMKRVMSALQKLARQSKAHVAVLHHTKGQYEDGVRPIPLSGSIQNVFKLPENGLTMWRPDPDHLAVAVVKNRNGKSDPGAADPILLPIDYSRATVGGFQEDR